MPPIRRVLVLAVEGTESLDILGPVEVFDYADRQVPGSYRIDVVGPATDGLITMSNRPPARGRSAARAAAAPRHAGRGGR